jgi:uncharacterized protein (TIGR03083 family)
VTVDQTGVIETQSARLVEALRANPSSRIRWSDKWTVATCARHVGSVHHVVAQVVSDRPTADFGRFKTLTVPEGEGAELADWIAEGTSTLVRALRAAGADDECWSWWPDGRTVGFWERRMAQETLVHRWDAELGAGISGAAMDPPVASDGIDEYLDVFAGVTRQLHSAPAGPSIHVHCTDTEGEWLLQLPAPGERTLTREHVKADVAVRGPAEGLLLVMWGRAAPADVSVEVIGDTSVVDRWSELLPPM